MILKNSDWIELTEEDLIPSSDFVEEIADEDILEYVFEETGVDFTGVKYQNEGKYALMASSESPKPIRSLASSFRA